MSATTYRAAVDLLRVELDMLGPYRGPSGFHDGPDARVRVAEAIAGRVVGGDDAESVGRDYWDRDDSRAEVYALELTVAVLAADRRLHGITLGRAAGIDREVWAESVEKTDA